MGLAPNPYGAISELAPMRLPCVFTDENGDSYFGDVATTQPDSTAERIFDLTSWQVWETKPGFEADFKPVPEPQALAMMTGRLSVTVSTGETRYYSQGDTFLLQDTSGKGHAIRCIGKELTSVMVMTLKEPVT